jgi:hypothetical protein
MRIRRCFPTLALIFVTSQAFGQELGVGSYGLRAGINANPDQLNVGAHLDVGRLAERVRLRPSFEVGLGNGVVLGAANFDAHYLFSGGTLRPYAGGGLGLNVIEVTNGIGQGGGLDLAPVLNFVGGVEWGSAHRGSTALGRYLLEARVGMGDTPDLKLVFGVSF